MCISTACYDQITFPVVMALINFILTDLLILCVNPQQRLVGFQLNFMGTFRIRLDGHILSMLWYDDFYCLSLLILPASGESGITGKGVHMYKSVGVRFADLSKFS